MRLYRTKYFGLLTHYTTDEGARGIMNEGYRVPKQVYGTSYFGAEDDYIRQNKTNFPKERDLVLKLSRKLEDQEDIIEKELRKEFGPEFYKNQKAKERAMELGHQMLEDFYSLANFGNIKLNKNYTPVFDTPEQTSVPKKLLVKKEGVHYPKDLVQMIHIRGIAGQRHRNNPVYRVVSDTVNDNDIYTVMGINEHRTAPSNIKSNMLEIPSRAMEDRKVVRRGYINNFMNGFDKFRFNEADEPTREALEKIRKKVEFLSKHHGRL